MICYLDSNALVKLFVDEPGSAEVIQAIRIAHRVGLVKLSGWVGCRENTLWRHAISSQRSGVTTGIFKFPTP